MESATSKKISAVTAFKNIRSNTLIIQDFLNSIMEKSSLSDNLASFNRKGLHV